MTLEEAQKIGRIIGTADAGCSVCVESLVDQLAAAFPTFIWTPTQEEIREQADWSDDPEDMQSVGYLVTATLAPPPVLG